MKRIITFVLLLIVSISAGISQSTIVYRDFESASDNWNYTATPPPYNVSGDTWDSVTSLSSITPQSGSYFWGMRDLDNPNGGGAFRHKLIFDAIDISGYTSVTLSFHYYTIGYDGSDSIFYNVQYDNGTNFPVSDDIELNKNTQAWTQVTVNVPSGTNYVRLQLSARQNGGSDYAGFDNIVLSGTTAGGVNNPTNFTASTVSTSEIDLSWTQNGNGDDVMVAWSSDGTFGVPLDGTTYAAGDAIPGGGTVLYNGSNTSYNHTGLTSGTQYYYKAWSVDGSATYSSGVTDDATTYKDEPSNHVTSFATGTVAPTSIPLTWDDNDGAVAADYFLVMINTTGTFSPPVDGTPQADDTDVSDGSGVVNVAHGIETYTWTGLNQNTHYYFTIYPYTNTGSAVDYKTDGTVPTADATTTTASTDLIISEVTDPKDTYQAKFVELYNTGADTIFFNTETWYLSRQANGGATSWADILLTDTIPPGEAYTVAYSQSNFNTAYGFDPDQSSGNISGNGDDGYFLYFGGDHTSGTLIDAYGVIDQDGSGTDWEYTDGKAVRKRSVGSPNTTWTASEWVITRQTNVVNMTPGQHFNYVTWDGDTDQYWDTKANWDNGFIPDASMDVTIPDVSSIFPPELQNVANVYNLTLMSSGQLNIKPSGQLTVYGDLSIASSKSRAAADLIIEADGSGQGSLITKGSVSGSAYVQSYVTNSQWHSIAAPVSGETADAYYLGGSPDVWLKEYDEATNTYSYVTSLSTPLGDMKGWMIWVGGSTAQTFTLDGSLRTGTVGSTDNMVRSQAGADYGYNFVGNPFPSAIDWDASSGWTKTNIDDAIYVYNQGNWATYSGGSGTNGGSQYIAMNQGFFVQVSDGSNNGTLQMTRDVCVHDDVNFLKSAKAQQSWDDILRLEVTNGALSDETVIKLTDGATEGWDGNLDAHKLFSFNTNHPQLFSTANGKMAINSLPHETGSVALDVTGADGDEMTIMATDHSAFSHVYLTDEALGMTTDLTRDNYTFTYDKNITDRFTLSFTVTGLDENKTAEKYFSIYAANGSIHVIQPQQNETEVSVFNLLGQKVAGDKSRATVHTITVPRNTYYLIHVLDGTHTQSEKVFVK